MRLIRSIVEPPGDISTEYYELPDDWDDMTETQQDNYLTETAVTHQTNVAPCGASVVDVDDAELERLRRNGEICE